jgi:hypothetical protein
MALDNKGKEDFKSNSGRRKEILVASLLETKARTSTKMLANHPSSILKGVQNRSTAFKYHNQGRKTDTTRYSTALAAAVTLITLITK